MLFMQFISPRTNVCYFTYIRIERGIIKFMIVLEWFIANYLLLQKRLHYK